MIRNRTKDCVGACITQVVRDMIYHSVNKYSSYVLLWWTKKWLIVLWSKLLSINRMKILPKLPLKGRWEKRRGKAWSKWDKYSFQSRKRLYHSKCLSICPSVRHQNPSASQNRAYQPNLSLLAIKPLCQSATIPTSQPLRIITIGHHAYQLSCPYGLLTYALLSRLLSHFGLFYFKT